MRSLILGEDYPIRELIAAMLEPFGECVSTSDADKAIELFGHGLDNRNGFELIVCDVTPYKEGREKYLLEAVYAIRALEESSPPMPFGPAKLLLLAAFRDPETLMIIEELPPANFLRKPFDDEALDDALERLELF